MSKRFIDTGFLDKPWIRKLQPEQKSFLIYLMLKCDNAGIIELDLEDAEFWIRKKIGDPLKFLPENYLIPLKQSGKFFLTGFIKWQYRDLSSNKNIISQARQILENHGLLNEDFTIKLPESYLKVSEELPESQVTSNSKGIGIGNGIGKEEEKKPILKNCLMRNSNLTIRQVREDFLKREDLKSADFSYYFNAALDWSDSKGQMSKDWPATIRNFARRDIRDGKLKVINEDSKIDIELNKWSTKH